MLGDDLGRAILLSFNTPTPTVNGGGSGVSGTPALPKEEAFPTEGIQLDAPRMSTEYYKAIGALRNYTKEMSARGIDVTGAPDLNNPQWLQANELFQDLTDQVRYLGEKLTQGRDNQKALQSAYLAGTGNVSQKFLNPTGVIDSHDITQYGYSQAPKFIDEYNSVLKVQPETQEEYDELQAFYNEALNQVDVLVREQNMPAESREYYRSLIQPPRPFDAAMYNAELGLKKAKTFAENAKGLRQKAAAAKDEGELYPVFPEISELAQWMRSPTAGTNFPGRFFQGSKLNGNGLPFSHIEKDERRGPGHYMMIFQEEVKDPFARTLSQSLKPQLKKEAIPFSDKNILPAWFATMSKEQAAQTNKVLKTSGLGESVSTDEILNYHKQTQSNSFEPQKENPYAALRNQDPEAVAKYLKEQAEAEGKPLKESEAAALLRLIYD